MSAIEWEIQSVTLADAPALARNNMSAFWEDPSWVVMWKGITLPYLISQATLRMPNNLLKDQAVLRHQKAVDPATGALVGYARWKLPESHTHVAGLGVPEWAGAQTAEVGADQRARIKETFDSAWWSPGDGPPDDKASGIKNAILAQRPHLLLDYLAVHPENKNKGIATALVASGLREAAKMGLPVCTFALKAGERVYKKLGFKIVDSVIQDDTEYGGPGEYAVYIMTWEENQ